MFNFLSKQNPASEPAKSKEDERAELANAVLETMDDGAVIAKTTGEIVYMNTPAAHAIGYNDPAELIGLSFMSILVMENKQGVRIPDDQNPILKAVQAGEAWSSRDYVIVGKQGQKIPESINIKPIDDDKEEFVAVFRDISKVLEKESEQAEFISTASHEMRTPVASIEGYLGLALNPATATIDDRARQYLTEAHSAAKHLGRLFRDLLDVTNLDDRRLKIHLVPSNIAELTKGYTNAHIHACQEKNLQLSFGNDNSDARIEQSTYAMVDVDFLRESVDNLIENAIKYTPVGGSIWVNVRSEKDKVLINVTDTGMGIPPDHLDHIFQKFYRVDNSQTREIGGTGLGLYIVRQRVEALGGNVWAESSFGQGSTFYISLPRMTDAEYERQKMVYANSQAMMPTQPPNNLATQAIENTEIPSEFLATKQPEAPVEPIEDDQTLAGDLSDERLAELKQKFASQMSQDSTSVE